MTCRREIYRVIETFRLEGTSMVFYFKPLLMAGWRFCEIHVRSLKIPQLLPAIILVCLSSGETENRLLPSSCVWRLFSTLLINSFRLSSLSVFKTPPYFCCGLLQTYPSSLESKNNMKTRIPKGRGGALHGHLVAQKGEKWRGTMTVGFWHVLERHLCWKVMSGSKFLIN